MIDRTTPADPRPHSLLYHCQDRQILRTSCKTALFVGITLALINHFDGIFDLRLTFKEIIQILITFLVPFSVATYSAARHLQYLEKINALRKTSPDPIHSVGQTTMDRGRQA